VATYAPQNKDESYYSRIRYRLVQEHGAFALRCLPFERPTRIADRIRDRDRWEHEKAVNLIGKVDR
jgi:hypothetical protein